MKNRAPAQVSPAATVDGFYRAVRVRPAWQVAILLGIVLLAILRSSIGTRLDGLTLDEPYHMLAAVAYAERGAHQLNPEHPPLVKRLAGAALASQLRLPPIERLRNKLAERNLAEQVVFLEHDAARLQQRTRIAMYGLNGGLLFVVLLLARYVFGFGASAVVGGWLALDPTVSAHLPVLMTDLPLALALGVATLTAAVAVDSWSGSRNRVGSWLWTGALGVAAGLCLATKHSALPGLIGLLVFGIVHSVAAAVRRRRAGRDGTARAVLQLACRGVVVVLLALATLWSLYDFRFHAARDGSDPFHRPLEQKIEEVSLVPQRAALRWADRLHLTPRAYLWGLADTIRAGVEGRGQDRHVLFGRVYVGAPPWTFWPGILLSKIPLPHLLLALSGLAALLRWPPPRPSPRRTAFWALGAVGAAHVLALAMSRGTYGGVRHALPLVLVLAVLASGVVQLRRSRWPRGAVLGPAVLLTTTFAVTAAEPRLWEYHNRLAGGTAGAAGRFDNEGVHLGQRLPEVARFWHEKLGAPAAPLYFLTPLIEEEAASLGLPITPRVRDVYDQNRRGRYEGYFLVQVGATRHRPSPSPADLAGLDEVVRLGNVRLLAGTVESPGLRASGLLRTVGEYLNQTRSPDWLTLARRMEELVVDRPESVSGWILLGNCRVALGDRQAAVAAFRRALDSLDATEPYKARIRDHLAVLESGTPIDQVPFLPIASAE